MVLMSNGLGVYTVCVCIYIYIYIFSPFGLEKNEFIEKGKELQGRKED